MGLNNEYHCGDDFMAVVAKVNGYTVPSRTV